MSPVTSNEIHLGTRLKSASSSHLGFCVDQQPFQGKPLNVLVRMAEQTRY